MPKFAKIFVCVVVSIAGLKSIAHSDDVFPATDPSNEGKWELNKDISDEFEQPNLNTEKWLVQGTGGEYRSNWIGRAPSQFSTDNVRVEDGKLKIQTRWETDFDFSEKIDRSDASAKEGRTYENITTAAVISKNQFSDGYMETKCKAADASVTSSFWMTGKKSELDVFEFTGAPKLKKKLETRFQSNVIDWGKPKGVNRRVWRGIQQLNWRVADDFHVYGCDWTESGLKFYVDGELIQSVISKELGKVGCCRTHFGSGLIPRRFLGTASPLNLTCPLISRSNTSAFGTRIRSPGLFVVEVVKTFVNRQDGRNS